MEGLDVPDANLTEAQLFQWLARALGRAPEPFDLFHAGKRLYQLGAYASAAKLLQLYANGRGAEKPGNHLLGHAYYMIGNKQRAVEELRKCVNSGFDGDWQLLVQLQLEADRDRGMFTTRSAAKSTTTDGALAEIESKQYFQDPHATAMQVHHNVDKALALPDSSLETSLSVSHPVTSELVAPPPNSLSTARNVAGR